MTSIGIIGQAIKKEGTVTGRLVEEHTGNPETGKRIDIPVECARNKHTEFCLNAHSF